MKSQAFTATDFTENMTEAVGQRLKTQQLQVIRTRVQRRARRLHTLSVVSTKTARQSAVITQQVGQLQENNIISNNPDRAKSVGVVLYINVMIIWIFIESLHGVQCSNIVYNSAKT